MISIVYPYFEQPEALERHLENWEDLMPRLADLEDVVIVDDHSTEDPAIWGLCWRTFYIESDLGWNITGAKNIGMHEAQGPWCFLGDLDHLVTPEMLAFAMSEVPKPGHFYIFPRRLEGGRESDDYHQNFLLIRKEDFWKAGGYDEDFAGGYGWEDVWFKQVAEGMGLKRIKVPDVYSQAIGDIPDACMPAEMRDSSRNGKLLQRKRVAWVNSRKIKLFAQNSNPLRCKYHEVTGTPESCPETPTEEK